MKVTCGIFLYSKARNKLLVCHATNSRWTQWSIPKGMPGQNESLLDAATRELREETAIELALLDILGAYELPSVKYTKQDKRLESFLVIVSDDLETHVFKSNLVENEDFPEIDSWKWVDLDSAEKVLHESQAKNISVVRNLIIDLGE